MTPREEALIALAEKFSPKWMRNPDFKWVRDRDTDKPREVKRSLAAQMDDVCTTVRGTGEQREIHILTYAEVVDTLIDAGIISD